MNKLQVFEINNKRIYIPISQYKIEAGFPSPASDYEEERLDINDIVVSNPNSTFYIRVKGNSMIDANIFDGDILVVDKSLDVQHGNIVIAVINNEFTVKRLYKKETIKLIPANLEFPEIIIKEDEELNIWGVVTYIIHKAK